MIGPVPTLAFVPPAPPLLPVPIFAPPIAPGPAFPGPEPGLPDFLQPVEFPVPPGPDPVRFEPGGVPILPLPRQLFDEAPEIVPLIPPPFFGGQCPQRYRVTFTGRGPTAIQGGENCVGDAPRDGTADLWGPIGGLQVIEQSCQGGPGGGGARRGVSNWGSTNTSRRTSPQITNLGGVSYSLQITSVALLDPGQDDCGDLPNEQERERAPNPARNFVPSPLFVPEPEPQTQPPARPFPDPGPTPDPEPERRPDRRVPGPPLPIGPITPPEVVPFEPGTIPDLPTVPDLDPPRLPPFAPPGTPSRVAPPGLPVLSPPGVPPILVVPPQFVPLPPELPTRRDEPVVEIDPPLTRVPPVITTDCCALPEVRRQGESIQRKLDKLKFPEECVDLCDPATMFETACLEGDNSEVITTVQPTVVESLAAGLNRLSDQIADIAVYLNICAPRPEAKSGCPPPGDVGQPTLPVLTGVSGEASGVVESGFVLTGLRLDFAAVPQRANQYREGVYRGAAYVYMGTPAGLDQDYAGSMLRDGQFIFAEQCNLTNWTVTANAGYNLLVTPFVREV